MTQWAAELILALRRAGWPEPENGLPAFLGWVHRPSATSVGIWADYALALKVTDGGDCVRMKGPPAAVADALQHWRWVADG